MSREYVTDINYPVRYSNLPADKFVVNDVPDKLTLTVESFGYILLKHKIKPAFSPILIDVNSYPLYPVNEYDKNSFFLFTNNARASIADQLSSEMRVLDIKPDSLLFKFGVLKSKKVIVIPNMNIQIEKPYMVKNNIHIQPDSIIVQGPDYIIDTINSVQTKLNKIRKPENTIVKSFLLKDIESVTFSSKKVILTIPVEKFTESKIKAPVLIKNLPDSVNLKVFPSSIEITFMVALSDYNSIKPDLFTAEVDYNSILDNIDEYLRVTISRYPDYIKSIQYNPKMVEYIIEK